MSEKKDKTVSRNNWTAWTLEEIRFVEQHYRKLSVAEIGRHLGRTRLIRIWLAQERHCPVCRQMIGESTGWRLFHVKRTLDGGRDTNSNLIMLHPDCYQIARARRFKVVKPAPPVGL